MKKTKLSGSARKYIRREKSRIRKIFLTLKEQEEAIDKLRVRFGMSIPSEENPKETKKKEIKK